MSDNGPDGPEPGDAPRPATPRRKRLWTRKNVDRFFTTLAETANVRQAAARADLAIQSIYLRRRTDPAFAARWAAALEEGYARLEQVLLDQSVNGFERVETVTDADGTVKQVKRVRSFPHGVGLRLLRSHGEAVERYRAMAAGRDSAADEAVSARIRAELAQVRRRLAKTETPEDDGG